VNSLVRFKPSAERDVESAFIWYEQNGPGLGDEFLDEIGAAVTRITENPRAHHVIRWPNQKGCRPSFPLPHFHVIDPLEIVILACLHASRDPESWPTISA
jgi:plasmid stabilization system protein ParE